MAPMIQLPSIVIAARCCPKASPDQPASSSAGVVAHPSVNIRSMNRRPSRLSSA
jgi:hypothetical protein